MRGALLVAIIFLAARIAHAALSGPTTKFTFSAAVPFAIYNEKVSVTIVPDAGGGCTGSLYNNFSFNLGNAPINYTLVDFKIKFHPSMNPVICGGLTANKELILYQSIMNFSSPIHIPNFVDAYTFGSSYQQCFYTSQSTIYRWDATPSLCIQASLGNLTAKQIESNGTYLYVYGCDPSLQSYILILDEELNIIYTYTASNSQFYTYIETYNSINYQYHPFNQLSVSPGFIIHREGNVMEIMNSNLWPLWTHTPSSPGNILDSIICLSVLFTIDDNNNLKAYHPETFVQLATLVVTLSSHYVTLKCLDSLNVVSLKIFNTNKILMFNFSFPVPFSQDFSLYNPLTVVPPPPPPPPPVIPPPVVPPAVNPATSNSDNQNYDFENFNAILGPIITIVSSSRCGKALMGPVFGFIEDFWLYGYHEKVYPQFFQQVTRETDLLNLLKLKPKFMEKLKVSIPTVEKSNSIQAGMLNMPRAPVKQYILQAGKDFYIFYAGINVVTFLLMRLIYWFLKQLRKQMEDSSVIQSLYTYFEIKAASWNFVASLVELNISSMIFYATVQFNSLFLFNAQDKLNGVCSILIFFVALFYTFCFYPMIYRYKTKKNCEDLLNLTNYQFASFYAESNLTCTRALFHAMVHANLLIENVFALGGLIFVDLVCLILTLKFGKFFINKGLYIFTVAYLLVFVGMDCFIMFYHQKLFKINYETILTGFVLALLVLTILKMVCFLFQMSKQVKSYFFPNEIADQSMKTRENLQKTTKRSQKTTKKFKKSRKKHKEDNQEKMQVPRKSIGKNGLASSACSKADPLKQKRPVKQPSFDVRSVDSEDKIDVTAFNIFDKPEKGVCIRGMIVSRKP